MTTIGPIIADLAKAVLNHGSKISSKPLDAVGQILSFTEDVGCAPDSPEVVAALATIFLKPKDIDVFLQSYDIAADTFPKYESQSFGAFGKFPSAVLGGERPQAVMAAATLLAFYAQAVHAGTTAARQTYFFWMDIWDDSYRNIELKVALQRAIDRVGPYPADGLKRDDNVAFFTISIDLGGSTKAKSDILEVVNNDQARVDEYNKQLYRWFCRAEREFYKAASGHTGMGEAISPMRFFPVKSIGDEVWILCEVPITEVSGAAVRLIDAALHVVDDSLKMAATENDPGVLNRRDFDYGKLKAITTNIKVFMDLVERATCIEDIRDKGIAKELPGILEEYFEREPTTLEYNQALRRLSLCGYESLGLTSTYMMRTDFIGHEIDRFFRASKAALSGVVAIGHAMKERAALQFRKEKDDICEVVSSDGQPIRGGFPIDPIYAKKQTLVAEDLNGIGYDYDIHLLFVPRALRGVYEQVRADKANKFVAVNYEKTLEALPYDTVLEIAKKHYPPQSS